MVSPPIGTRFFERDFGCNLSFGVIQVKAFRSMLAHSTALPGSFHNMLMLWTHATLFPLQEACFSLQQAFGGLFARYPSFDRTVRDPRFHKSEMPTSQALD
jgi:hypothetical protein